MVSSNPLLICTTTLRLYRELLRGECQGGEDTLLSPLLSVCHKPCWLVVLQTSAQVSVGAWARGVSGLAQFHFLTIKKNMAITMKLS